MSVLLSQSRAVMELQTQSGEFVFGHEPQAVDLSYVLTTPTQVNLTVEGGDVFSDRQGANSVLTEVKFDQFGRPVSEYVINEDKGEETTRTWEYAEPDNPDNSDCTSTHTDPELNEYRRTFQKGVVQFMRNGIDFTLLPELRQAGQPYRVAIRRGEEHSIHELVTYDADGKLQRLEVFDEDTKKVVDATYEYDAFGRVEYVDATPKGDMTPPNTPSEMRGSTVMVEYKPDLTIVRNLVGGQIENMREERRYDAENRPVSIKRESGMVELGLQVIKAEIQYSSVLASK